MGLRRKIKMAIYWSLMLDQELADYITDNYTNKTATDLIYEHAQRITTDEVEYPAIRYNLINSVPIKPFCNSCRDCREVTFDIYVEDREESLYKIDDLLDIFKHIFLKRGGRALGSLTQTQEYMDAINGASPSKMTFEPCDVELSVWNTYVLMNNLRKGEGSRNNPADRYGPHATEGKSSLGSIRFRSKIANTREFV